MGQMTLLHGTDDVLAYVIFLFVQMPFGGVSKSHKVTARLR